MSPWLVRGGGSATETDWHPLSLCISRSSGSLSPKKVRRNLKDLNDCFAVDSFLDFGLDFASQLRSCFVAHSNIAVPLVYASL